ncbi:MAG: hypothetical protein WCH99_12660 [Verrucomicrobiota bacterium]
MKKSPIAEKLLHASARLVAGFILMVLTISCRLMPEWDYGIYDKTKFWVAAQNFLVEFSAVCLPSIAILFLWPLVIRGTPKQKVAAIVVSAISALIAIPGWLGVVGKFLEIWH